MLTNTMVKCNFKKQGEFDLSYTDNFIKLNPLNKNEFYQIRYESVGKSFIEVYASYFYSQFKK